MEDYSNTEKAKPAGKKNECPGDSDILLGYEHVQISYGGKPVIKDLSFSIARGEIFAVVGESGSGKSTLLRAAAGLLGNGGLVTQGDIIYRGVSIPDAAPETLRQMRGSGIGMIFQDAAASFSPVRKIRKQLIEAVRAHEKIPENQIEERALKLLALMGIEDGKRVLDSFPFELSGGMNQRVGILAAVFLQPDLLLADEPTSALDVSVQAKILKGLSDLRRNQGTAVLLVTHNIGAAQKIADRIGVMHQGRMVECGETEQIMQAPQDPYTRELLQAIPRLRRR